MSTRADRGPAAPSDVTAHSLFSTSTDAAVSRVATRDQRRQVLTRRGILHAQKRRNRSIGDYIDGGRRVDHRGEEGPGGGWADVGRWQARPSWTLRREQDERYVPNASTVGATFCPPPLFPESQTLPLKGRGLIGDGSRARPRATRHPDRVRPAPHPPRRTHPLGARLHPAHRLNKPHPNPRPQCRRRTQRWARPGRGSRRRVIIREPELAYRRERTGHAPRRYERR